MEVSSVHSPGFRLNGPPPMISVIGTKVPGALNSKVVPSASPIASPRRAPRYLSRVIWRFERRPVYRPFLDPSHLLGGFQVSLASAEISRTSAICRRGWLKPHPVSAHAPATSKRRRVPCGRLHPSNG